MTTETDIINHFHTAYGQEGVIALTWLIGAFLAEEIRELPCSHHRYPLLHISGHPASGKTSLISFLNKLTGNHCKTFYPQNCTAAAFVRTLRQAEKTPVIMYTYVDPSFRKINFQQIYSGESLTLGTKKNSETMTIKCAAIIEDSMPMDYPENIKARFLTIELSKTRHSAEGKQSDNFLHALPLPEIFNLMQRVQANKDALLQAYQAEFQNTTRGIHIDQLLALSKIANLVFPKMAVIDYANQVEAYFCID